METRGGLNAAVVRAVALGLISPARAEKSVLLTRERCGQGLALLTQLLDADTALTATRQRRAAAAADLQIAAAAVDRALGREWEEINP
jgi:outer membrane protein TolC